MLASRSASGFHLRAGEPSWIRTSDLLIKSQLLYRLSYGPTLAPRLPSWGAAGKAVCKMSDLQGSDAPARGDEGEGLEDETALGQPAVRDCKLSRTKASPAPEGEIKVEHARCPAFARTPAKFALDALQATEHLEGAEIAFDDCDCIGEITTRTAVRRIEQYRRCVEQPEFLVEMRNRCLDDAGRTSITAMRPV